MVGTRERQQAAIAAAVSEWEAAARPDGFLSSSFFASTDGHTTFSYAQLSGAEAQLSGAEAHDAFLRNVRPGMLHAIDEAVPSLDEIAEALSTLPAEVGPTGREWTELSSSWRPLLDERIRLLKALRDNLDGCIGYGCLSLERCRLRNPYDRAAELGAGPRYLLGDEPVA